MKVEIETVDSLTRKVKVVVPADRVALEMDKVYQDLKRNARIRGFRPGKAPRSILERYFGDHVRDQVCSQLIEETMGHIIQEHGLKAVGSPIVEETHLQEGEPLVYTAKVEVLPEIDVTDYEGLEVPDRHPEVTQDKVSKRIEEIRELFARLEDVQNSKPVGDGDFVVLKVQILLDGEPYKSPEEKVVELKEGLVEERLRKALLGVMPGQKVQVPHRFPKEERDKALAGKEAILELTVEKIRRKVLPDLTDEFARRLGDYEDLDQLKAKIAEEIEEEEKRAIDSELREAIIDQLLKKYQFQVPEALVAAEMESIMVQAGRRLAVHGVSREHARGLLEQMKDRYRDAAIRNVKASLVLQAIADKEGLEVTEERIREAMERIARQTGRDLSQVQEVYSDERAMSRLREMVKEELALEFLKQKAKMVTETQRSQRKS